MSKRFILFSLGIYGIGCGVSQSLMSLGGALFVVIFLELLFTSFPRSSQARWVAGLGLGWMMFSIANLLAHGWQERTGHTLGTLPLILVPASAILWNAGPQRRFKAGDLAWPLALTSVALFASVGKAIWQFFGQGQQAFGFLRNPIYFAYNLLPACVVFAEIALRKLRFGFFKPAWAGWVSAACLLGIICSVSRTALACSLAYLALRTLPVLRKRLGTRLTVLSLVGLVAFGAILVSRNAAFKEKFYRTFSAEDPARHWRLIAWRHNWELFVATPLTGTGPERNGIDTAKMPEYAGHWQPHTLIFAHSIYLQSLADNGLIGTALLVGFWLAFASTAPFAIPIVVILAIAGLTENTFNNSKAAHAVLFYSLLCAFIGSLLGERSDESA